MADAASQLQQAYNLIEAGDLQSARQLLNDVKSDNENNPDFWWVYAHALEDEAEGRQALERVAQLAPNYPELDKVFIELGMTPPQVQATASAPPPPPPNAPSTDDVDDFHEAAQLTSTSDKGNSWLVYAGVATIVVLIVAFLLFNALSGGPNQEIDETPTSVVVAPTAQPIIPTTEPVDAEVDAESAEETEQAEETITETIEVTEESVASTDSDTSEEENTEEASETDTSDEGDTILLATDELAIFSVPTDGITLETTETFGESYVVVTCSPLGPIATQNIVNIVDSLGDNISGISDTVGGFAFRVTDCDADTTLLTLGFDIETLNDYWAGEITQSQLQQNLQRVN